MSPRPPQSFLPLKNVLPNTISLNLYGIRGFSSVAFGGMWPFPGEGRKYYEGHVQFFISGISSPYVEI